MIREKSLLCKILLCRYKPGVNRMTINNYELGKRVPDLDFAIKAADYFSVSLEYIAGRTEYTDKVGF